MSALIRDTAFGQTVRYFTNNRVFQYPEERPDFRIPTAYTGHAKLNPKFCESSTSCDFSESDVECPSIDEAIDIGPDLEKIKVRKKNISVPDLRTMDNGTILVDWYGTEDPANPQNWSFGKKAVVVVIMLLYTMGVYMGSAIYTPSIPGVMEEFGVGIGAASLGLSMYVLAYGIGPLLFSPLSEVPIVGRSPPYLVSYTIFVILLVPTGLVNNFSGFIALRFLLGFTGSPCLSTGGATFQDLYSLLKLPYVISLWSLAATAGPALGPIVSGFSIPAKNWRWSTWEMLWMNGPILISMFFFFPETSAAKILLHRAQRLRKLTGNSDLKSQSEIDQTNLNPRGMVFEAMWRPFQLMLLDPSIAFAAMYIAIVYGIFYSFFESFPLVYIDMYGFNPGEMGLTLLSVVVGSILATAGYWWYIYYRMEPEIRAHGAGVPERRLIPAMYVTFLLPVGLFLFGWTARPDFHWIVSCIGITIAAVGIFLIIQSIFLYLPASYPQYVASLFAGNSFTRSALAAASIHFSHPMFHSLGVDRGTTLLAGLTFGCSVGVFVLFWYGAKLRARSRFAA